MSAVPADRSLSRGHQTRGGRDRASAFSSAKCCAGTYDRRARQRSLVLGLERARSWARSPTSRAQRARRRAASTLANARTRKHALLIRRSARVCASSSPRTTHLHRGRLAPASSGRDAEARKGKRTMVVRWRLRPLPARQPAWASVSTNANSVHLHTSEHPWGCHTAEGFSRAAARQRDLRAWCVLHTRRATVREGDSSGLECSAQ